jgi:hypothetical protein
MWRRKLAWLGAGSVGVLAATGCSDEQTAPTGGGGSTTSSTFTGGGGGTTSSSVTGGAGAGAVGPGGTGGDGGAGGSVPLPTGPVFGWGGYILTAAEVVPLLDELVQGGYDAVRYWARPVWAFGPSNHAPDFDVLDLLVAEAAARGIVVYVDPEHNYPPDTYLSGHTTEWIDDLKLVCQRYQGAPNVVLECVNEYTGDDQESLYNQAIAALRSDGCHLPLLLNFWWNQPNVALVDPDDNYAVGRHLYGSSQDGNTAATPIALADAVTELGIDQSMDRYFHSTSETMYLQSVLDLGIPNGWVLSEMGPTDNEALVDDPSVGNMAYATQLLREAVEHDVSVICYRVGEYSEKAVYEARALHDFGEPYFVPAP